MKDALKKIIFEQLAVEMRSVCEESLTEEKQYEAVIRLCADDTTDRVWQLSTQIKSIPTNYFILANFYLLPGPLVECQLV